METSAPQTKDYIFQGDDDVICDQIVYFLYSFDKSIGVRQSAPMLFYLQSGEFGAYRLRDKDAEKQMEKDIERDMAESFNDYNQSNESANGSEITFRPCYFFPQKIRQGT